MTAKNPAASDRRKQPRAAGMTACMLHSSFRWIKIAEKTGFPGRLGLSVRLETAPHQIMLPLSVGQLAEQDR
jgi:hypothetical protein